MNLYKINSDSDIDCDPQEISGEESLNILTNGLTENVDYILSEVDIREDVSYTGIRGESGELKWKNVNGTPTLRTDSDKVEEIRDGKLMVLRNNYSDALLGIDYHEGKAKTLVLDWLQGGSVGDPPDYWTNWKSGRDTIDGNYNTKKTYINDAVRTSSELESYDVSL